MTWQILMMTSEWRAYLTHYHPITPECWHTLLNKGGIILEI